jgi:methyl-accepting chemotaxis protein
MPSLQTPAPLNRTLFTHSVPDNPTEGLINNHRHFVMNVALLSVGLMLLASILDLSKLVVSPTNTNVWSILILLIFTFAQTIAWFLAKKGRVRPGGGVLLLSMLGMSTQGILFSSLSMVSILSFLAVALGGLIILGAKAAYAFAAFGSAMLIVAVNLNRFQPFTDTATDLTKPGPTDLLFLIIIVFVIVWLANYLAKSFNQATERLNHQASKLQSALFDIEEKRALGEDVSRQVFSLTAELNAIASQQASGSQQQVSALTQVTAFFQEMTATAQAIAHKTDLLSQAAHEIKMVTNRVKSATEEVSRVGENGAIAVEETINGNHRVNNVYAELQQILGELSQQQSQIKAVVSTIRGLSDETHLLSLNAAIEAAGAGQQGERFAVVAGEVKALADRSVRASRQVNEILGQVEQRIRQATSAAQSGHQEIQTALETAQQSGQVMRELVVAIYQTGSEIEQIDQATSVMNEQSKEISLATNQQYSASNQALDTLQSIGYVASQNATGSVEVIKSTCDLEQLSHNLLSTLVGRN